MVTTASSQIYISDCKVLYFVSPTAFGLVLVRPLVPFVIRTIPLYWRMKIIDWLPLTSLKEMRRIVGVMDKTSKKIYASKLVSSTSPNTQRVENGEGDLGSRGKGNDIMTILRTSIIGFGDFLTDIGSVKANASAVESDRLSEEELLGQMK